MPKTNTFFAFLLAVSLVLAACVGAAQAAGNHTQSSCPTTKPDPETRLYGPEDGLRVFIANEGVWDKLPVYEDDHIGQKIFWKYPGYDWQSEPQPEFLLAGEILNGKSYFESRAATNAYHEQDLLGSAILTGIAFPHTGCWQLTGHYRDSQLSFIVWVEGE